MTRTPALLTLGAATALVVGPASAAGAAPMPSPGFDDVGTGMPPEFAAFFVLALLGGLAATLWRVSLARQVARDAGMDPDRATAMTLLSDDGLDATYLAANLRDRPDAPRAESLPGQVRGADERLRELARLRDEGLVTQEEYDARRKAILDSL